MGSEESMKKRRIRTSSFDITPSPPLYVYPEPAEGLNAIFYPQYDIRYTQYEIFLAFSSISDRFYFIQDS